MSSALAAHRIEPVSGPLASALSHSVTDSLHSGIGTDRSLLDFLHTDLGIVLNHVPFTIP